MSIKLSRKPFEDIVKSYIIVALEASMPSSGVQGRVFISSDTLKIFIDTGTQWVLVGELKGLSLASHGSRHAYSAEDPLPPNSISSDQIASVDWSKVVNKPSTYPPSPHTHGRGDITDFWSAPFWDNIPDKPSTYPPSPHTHNASDIVSGTLSPDRIADGSITRTKLEYPTVNVKMVYLVAIGKTTIARDDAMDCIFTVDSFADKAISNLQQVGAVSGDPRGIMIARRTSTPNLYRSNMYAPASTSDFKIQRFYNNAFTDLATQAVDLTAEVQYTVTFSVSGSTLKAWRQSIRDLTASPTLTATDTAIASGQWGGRNEAFFSELLSPLSKLQQPVVIMEIEVVGTGNSEDPYRPLLLQELTQDGRDLNAVTWGAFEFSEKSPTNIIMIYEGNPYKGGAIERQKARAKRVFKVPKDYNEAVDLYNTLKKDYPHWLAGKDNLAYQALGWEELDLFQNVDFYYGEFIDHKTHYQQLKMVPDWEIRNRLSELFDKLSKVSVLTDERDKHINKVKEILRKGW